MHACIHTHRQKTFTLLSLGFESLSNLLSHVYMSNFMLTVAIIVATKLFDCTLFFFIKKNLERIEQIRMSLSQAGSLTYCSNQSKSGHWKDIGSICY